MPRIRGEGRDDGIAEKEKEREKEKEKEKHTGLLRLAQMITFLVVFAAGVVIGLTTSSHINRHFISQADQYAFINHVSSAVPQAQPFPLPQQPNCTLTPPQPPSSSDPEEVQFHCMDMDTFLHPTNLTHSMSDDELFWRASLVPKKQGYPYRRTPKVAFMFLTRGPLPMLPLWERFFHGHASLFNIYIHAPPGYVLNVSNSSAFYRRQIPSQVSN